MTSPHLEKTALFIDGPNLYATGKSLGFDIDFKRLLRAFQSQSDLTRAFYYTTVTQDQSSIWPLIDWLDYNGYTVVTKAAKEFVDETGRRGVRVTVVSTMSTHPPMIADQLRRQADVFLDIIELQPTIGRDTTMQAARERRPAGRTSSNTLGGAVDDNIKD